MPSEAFRAFMADTQLDRIEGAVAVVTTTNRYAKDWLESRMSSQIRKMLAVEMWSIGGQRIDKVTCVVI